MDVTLKQKESSGMLLPKGKKLQSGATTNPFYNLFVPSSYSNFEAREEFNLQTGNFYDIPHEGKCEDQAFSMESALNSDTLSDAASLNSEPIIPSVLSLDCYRTAAVDKKSLGECYLDNLKSNRNFGSFQPVNYDSFDLLSKDTSSFDSNFSAFSINSAPTSPDLERDIFNPNHDPIQNNSENLFDCQPTQRKQYRSESVSRSMGRIPTVPPGFEGYAPVFAARPRRDSEMSRIPEFKNVKRNGGDVNYKVLSEVLAPPLATIKNRYKLTTDKQNKHQQRKLSNPTIPCKVNFDRPVSIDLPTVSSQTIRIPAILFEAHNKRRALNAKNKRTNDSQKLKISREDEAMNVLKDMINSLKKVKIPNNKGSKLESSYEEGCLKESAKREEQNLNSGVEPPMPVSQGADTRSLALSF
ncbi:hypothetical protein AX774_g1756 [Zancudomyces culisetae]|uniref:Uncharacterized protein n=1 Tax=Zancudomyces culisetae TaxID=1213189 RepID=A0A1R1PUW4_ZANCU|nr:hypothetical protein AX774_g1756 [Zancudomyces culisetae]|eukprot:OMH84709.1 hypothetical protein AX774_g1756 [Zancudomyces culisetae]